MPAWQLETELIPAGKQIYGMEEADVRLKYMRYGPFPRHVLANTLAANQQELMQAVQDCTLNVLQSCFSNPGTAPKKMSHRLIEVTTTADHSQGRTQFASAAVRDELVQKFLKQNNHEVRSFLASSGGLPAKPSEATVLRASVKMPMTHCAKEENSDAEICKPVKRIQ